MRNRFISDRRDMQPEDFGRRIGRCQQLWAEWLAKCVPRFYVVRSLIQWSSRCNSLVAIVALL